MCFICKKILKIILPWVQGLQELDILLLQSVAPQHEPSRSPQTPRVQLRSFNIN